MKGTAEWWTDNECSHADQMLQLKAPPSVQIGANFGHKDGAWNII